LPLTNPYTIPLHAALPISEQSVLSYASNATALYNPGTGTTFGAQAVTGDNSANFFLGIADSYQQQRRPLNFNMKGKEVATYLQEDRKSTRLNSIHVCISYA